MSTLKVWKGCSYRIINLSCYFSIEHDGFESSIMWPCDLARRSLEILGKFSHIFMDAAHYCSQKKSCQPCASITSHSYVCMIKFSIVTEPTNIAFNDH